MNGIRRFIKNRAISPYLLVALVALSFAILLASYAGVYSYFKSAETDRAQSRLSLYQSTLLSALEQFQHVPFMLASDTFVVAGAEGRGLDALNVRLTEFADQARLDAIYLMDMQGLTIATSNWDAELTLLGHNYGFRPYFKQASTGSRGEFFAIGATTSRPGYFIAEPVRGATGDIIGVIAIKVNLNSLTEAWAKGGESVFVSNKDGIVVLASKSNWRYRAIEMLTDEVRQAIIDDRQFGTESLDQLNWEILGEDTASLDGESYLHVSVPLHPVEWRLHYLADSSRIVERSLVSVTVLAVALVALLALIIFQRSQRISSALKASQADRHALWHANSALENEIDVRLEAETRLTKAQEDLARSSRLAALGQLSASVTHELGQPIAAMRNYLTAAEMDSTSDPDGILERLGRIANRMESITKQLKFFASSGEKRIEKVDLRRLAEGVEILLGPDIAMQKIKLMVEMPDTPVLVKGNRLRLEQVLVNVMKNSIEATSETDERKIWLTISTSKDCAIMKVIDNGHGLRDQTTEQLMEPFHTTRASGKGMGLGLAISTAIVKEHEGSLEAENRDDGGAVFTIRVPLFAQETDE